MLQGLCSHRVLVPLAYLLGGLGVGAAPFQELAVALGVRPGVGTLVVINMILPLIAGVFGLLRPSPSSAGAGGLLLTLGYVAGAMLRRQPLPWLWSVPLLGSVTHPILIVATLGYAGIGVAAACVMRGAFDHSRANAKGDPANPTRFTPSRY